MGGHGPHIVGNENNMQETDEAMRGKIQSAELVKFNPQNFHLAFWDAGNMYTILGGAPAMIMGVAGATASLAYYQAAGAHKNFYVNNMRVTGRLMMGLTFGLALGYQQFGDRQMLHNAYLAERLRRRYPESMQLHQTDLWKLKGVNAPHDMYKWM